MDEFTVDSIDMVLETIAGIYSQNGDGWWFRGQRNSTWHLLPGVRRGYSKLQERYLTNLFYTRAKTRYTNPPSDNDIGGWLATMQHYGLPTRLMDWSSSPLVAAYFATKHHIDLGGSRADSDAAIWMIQPCLLNAAHGYEPVFPPLNAAGIQNLLWPAMKGDDDPNALPVLAASPCESDTKMLTQQGSFTIHTTEQCLDEMPRHENWLKKLVIPATALRRFELSLTMMGLRLADLFPDLSSLAREITNMHRPFSP